MALVTAKYQKMPKKKILYNMYIEYEGDLFRSLVWYKREFERFGNAFSWSDVLVTSVT